MKRLFSILTIFVMLLSLVECRNKDRGLRQEPTAPTEESVTTEGNNDYSTTTPGEASATEETSQQASGEPWYKNEGNVAPKFREQDLVLNPAVYWLKETYFDLIGYAEDLGFVDLLHDTTQGFDENESDDFQFIIYHDGHSENYNNYTLVSTESYFMVMKVFVNEGDTVAVYEKPDWANFPHWSYWIGGTQVRVSEQQLKVIIATLTNIAKGSGDLTKNPIPESVDFNLK